MDSRRTLSIAALGANVRQASRESSFMISTDDEHDSGRDPTTDSRLYQRRSSRVRYLQLSSSPTRFYYRVYFAYLSPRDLIRCTRVCHRWHVLISQHPHLWRCLFLRPEYANDGYGGGTNSSTALHVRRLDAFVHVLGTRIASALVYIDLPVELVTVEVLRELANRCPNLQYLTLDFSSAMQLHDFSDLNEFPCNLKRLCICLSDVIFLEGFMRRIYTFLSSIHTLHIVGTIEKAPSASTALPDETESYETINVTKIKANAPNLRVINLYGISFIDDSHIEGIASGCIHLECLALNFCTRIRGTSLKNLMNRCRKVKCLLLQNTSIQDEAMLAVDWASTQLAELDISSTELSEAALLKMFSVAPALSYLAVPHCDGFTDEVMKLMMDRGKLSACRALDLSNTLELSPEMVHRFLTTSPYVPYRLEALSYTGNGTITEQFWTDCIRFLRRIKILIVGTSHSWFKQITRRIHIDQILEACAVHCPKLERLEVEWDPETLRFSDNSSKFIDHLRLRCTNLLSFVVSDGPYYEAVKANFERAERKHVVRTTTMYRTSIVGQLSLYNELRFN